MPISSEIIVFRCIIRQPLASPFEYWSYECLQFPPAPLNGLHQILENSNLSSSLQNNGTLMSLTPSLLSPTCSQSYLVMRSMVTLHLRSRCAVPTVIWRQNWTVMCSALLR